MTKLLLVESPTKAKRIASFLFSPEWKVMATRGHLRDLPTDSLGIDIDHGFAMSYMTLPTQKALISKLRTAVSAADAIYLATDPDREGEGIAWHVADLLKTELGSKPVHRIVCTAITPVAVQAALAASRPIDMALVEAQQARRAVDRLVGYLASPLACKLLDTRVSAGRVQSVCLRLLVDRDREREGFETRPYWTLGATFTVNDVTVEAQLARIQGKAPVLTRRDIVDRLMVGLQPAVFWVIGIPWSEANALLFEYMLPGTIFDLQMNTGSTLRFQFSSKQSVNRSDTSWFRQLGPGLALVLIGERDATTGELTSNRVVVTAGYDVVQELSTAGDIVGIDLPKIDPPTPTAISTPFQRIDVNLITAESVTGWVEVKLRIYNGHLTPIVVDANTIQIAYGYAENPIGPTEPAELSAFELASGQAVDLTITFAWQGEPYCTLSLFDYRFSITLVRK